jgi:ribosome-binding factor A
MSGNKFKKVKYEERILNDLNNYLRMTLREPRLQFATLTKVKLNNDFSLAYVYWDTFNPDSKENISKTFLSLAKKLRFELAKSLKVKHVPQLKFLYDEQFESEKKILDLMNNDPETNLSDSNN